MFTIETLHPDSAAAAVIVRAYLTDVASRWYGRPASLEEVDKALTEEPFDDLRGDSGCLLGVMEDGRAIACAGVRFVEGIAELTKVFTLPTERGRGAGTLLLRAVEQLCRDREVSTIRLDTRAELAEACALYERLGFARVEPFNAEPYSDRWYAKALDPA